MAGDKKFGVELLIENAKQLINLAALLIGGLMATLLSNEAARQHAVLALVAGLLGACALFLSVLFQYLVAEKNLGDAAPNWKYEWLALSMWVTFLGAIVTASVFVGNVI